MLQIHSALKRQLTLRKLRHNHPGSTILSAALKQVCFGAPVSILSGVTLNRVNLGGYSYISNDSIINNALIGRFCSLGAYLQIGLYRHPTQDFVSTYPAFYSNNNIGCPHKFRDDKIYDDAIPETKIGNDVWIGNNAIIPGGIEIADGAIIAAGSVVVKDVPAYAIVGGNPASLIRYRFSATQIQRLLQAQWWDWPVQKIQANVDGFSDMNKFQQMLLDSDKI